MFPWKLLLNLVLYFFCKSDYLCFFLSALQKVCLYLENQPKPLNCSYQVMFDVNLNVQVKTQLKQFSVRQIDEEENNEGIRFYLWQKILMVPRGGHVRKMDTAECIWRAADINCWCPCQNYLLLKVLQNRQSNFKWVFFSAMKSMYTKTPTGKLVTQAWEKSAPLFELMWGMYGFSLMQSDIDFKISHKFKMDSIFTYK